MASAAEHSAEVISLYQVTARFSDGAERNFAVAPGQTLLDAALMQEVNLLHQCRAGSCSSCVCQTVEGEIVMETSTSIALLPREIAEGKVLSCLSRAVSDCVVQFPYESALLDREGPRRYLAEVTACERLCGSVFELRLRIDDSADGVLPDFLPGTYFLLQIPRTEVTRSYSMVSIPSELPEMRFLIRYLPGGVMSRYLAEDCRPGDFLEIEGPYGDFALREGREPLIMVAGGTGLAPILSILDAIREARRNRAPIALYFGTRSLGDLFYLDELELRRQLMPNFRYEVIVEESDPAWSGPVGRVTDLLRSIQPGEGTRGYLCGPPPMVAAVTDLLVAAGVAPDAIHFERFTPAASTPTA